MRGPSRDAGFWYLYISTANRPIASPNLPLPHMHSGSYDEGGVDNSGSGGGSGSSDSQR